MHCKDINTMVQVMLLCSALLLCVTVLPLTTADIVLDNQATDHAWYKYKARYDKIYNTNTDRIRKGAFLQSLRDIIVQNLEHALGYHSYQAGLNAISDFPPADMMCFVEDVNGNMTNSRTDSAYDRISGKCTCDKVPCKTAVDWVKAKRVFKAGSQKCGDCYAWAATYVLGSASAIKAGSQAPDLSVQESKDCTYHVHGEFNNGCSGGDIGIVYQGLMKTTQGKSLKTSDYPSYNHNEGPLKCSGVKGKSAAATVTGVGRYNSKSSNVNPDDDCEIIRRLQIGPVGVSMCATSALGHLKAQKESIVYSNTKCTTECQAEMKKETGNVYPVNHAVMIVGYTDTAWIVQNSWGQDWGYNGLLKFSRGQPGTPKVCNLGYSLAWPEV